MNDLHNDLMILNEEDLK